MSNKIIITADEPIGCPKCGHHFQLKDGITRQTIERYESEFEEVFAAQRKELEESIEKEAVRKATKQFNDQIKLLSEQLSDSRKAEQDSKNLIVKTQVDTKAKVIQEFEQEKKAMAAELADKHAKLSQFREQEIELRTQKKALEEAHANQQLAVQRQLDEERAIFQKQIVQKEGERFLLIESEYKKKIEDAQKANEDLRRKLDQGSQQLQGEVLELELENMLTDAFRHDNIEEVKKGQRGADVLQTVCTSFGQPCGKIIWEAKRAEHWSEKWLQKLKDDQQEAKADIAVLVTTVMPKGVTEAFIRIGEIWVVAPHAMRPLAETLRVTLIEVHKIKLVNTGRNEKMELLYNYLASTQFSQKIRTMMEAFESMRSDLEAEKRAMQKIWAKRHAQIERVTTSMVSVVGELQAIAHESLPQLDSIDQLALPVEDLAIDK